MRLQLRRTWPEILGVLVLAACGKPAEVQKVAAPSEHAAWIAALDLAEAEPDPQSRCRKTPAPAGIRWPVELIEAVCADNRAPVAQAGVLRDFMDNEDWDGLRSHFDGMLRRHYAGAPELLLYRAFPVISWASEAEADQYSSRWFAARPEDPYALALRAKFRLQQAWNLRGTAMAKDVAPDAMQQAMQLAEEASQLASRAVVHEPRLLPGYFYLIDAAALTGNDEQSVRALRDGIKVSPGTYYLRQIALAYLEPKWGGSTEAMDRLVAEAQRHTASNPRLSLLRTQRAAWAGDQHGEARPGPALDEYRKALAFGPHYNTLHSAAYAARDAGRHAEAVMLWSQALQYTRDPVHVLTNRGVRWEAMREMDRALRDFAAASEINPLDPEPPYRAAYVEQTRQNFEAAGKLYIRSLELRPDHVDTLSRAVEMWVHQTNDPRTAKPYAERLAQLAPEDPKAWLLLANVHHELGDPRTRASAERFLALAPPDDPQWKHPIENVRSFLAE